MSFIESISVFFFFNDTATTEIYTLSLHDALPIYRGHELLQAGAAARAEVENPRRTVEARRLEECIDRIGDIDVVAQDRKSTRLNSSHLVISYAVFCLKKKKLYT